MKSDNDRESVKITSWEYRSPMSPKILLGEKFDKTRHYRFVRKDNVDKMRDVYGYTLSGKQFKGMELMDTSKDHHNEMQKDRYDRNRARAKSLDENLRREVNRSGQGKVFSED